MSDIEVKISKPIKAVRIESFDTEGRPFYSAGSFAEYGDPDQYWQQKSEAAYKLGFEDGKKIGFQEGREELKNVMADIKRILNDINKMRDEINVEADRTIATLAISIASVIIRREISVDHSIVKLIARDAIKAVEDKRHIAVRVNPDDMKYITDIKLEQLSIKELEIKEDSTIEAGGCIVESDSGIVDARIHVQLEEIAERIL